MDTYIRQTKQVMQEDIVIEILDHTELLNPLPRQSRNTREWLLCELDGMYGHNVQWRIREKS